MGAVKRKLYDQAEKITYYIQSAYGRYVEVEEVEEAFIELSKFEYIMKAIMDGDFKEVACTVLATVNKIQDRNKAKV